MLRTLLKRESIHSYIWAIHSLQGIVREGPLKGRIWSVEQGEDVPDGRNNGNDITDMGG